MMKETRKGRKERKRKEKRGSNKIRSEKRNTEMK